MPDVIQRLIGSTRFWALVIGIAVPILNRKFDLGLNVEEIIAILVGTTAYSISQSIRSSKPPKVAAIALAFLVLSAGNAEAKHPLRRLVSRSVDVGVYAVARTEVAVTNTLDHLSEKYQRALASAQYRAANRVHGHATHLELGGCVRRSGVGFASHDSNPMTCLGRKGFTSAICAVVRGPDGYYATCVD